MGKFKVGNIVTIHSKTGHKYPCKIKSISEEYGLALVEYGGTSHLVSMKNIIQGGAKMKFKLGDRVFAKNRGGLKGADMMLRGRHGVIQGYYTEYKDNVYLVKYPLVFIENEGLILHTGSGLKTHKRYKGKPSEYHDCWFFDEEDLMLSPRYDVTSEAVMYIKDINSSRTAKMPENVFKKYEVIKKVTDVQGEELHKGDKVVLLEVLNKAFIGRMSVVRNIIGNQVVDLDNIGSFSSQSVLKLKHNYQLPDNILVHVEGKKIRLTKVKNGHRANSYAICNPKDTFSLDYGVFCVALPRLFGKKARLDK
jgi:hypothetical protein